MSFLNQNGIDEMEFAKWLQSRLTSHGFPVGGIDGDVGKTTIAAIGAFQKSRGLKVNGLADAETVAELRKSSSTIDKSGLSIDRDIVNLPEYDTGPSIFPYQRDVGLFYGDVGADQTSITPPWRMRLAWDKRRYIKKMTLHRKCADSALRAMNQVLDHYGDNGVAALGLSNFGGSLNIRKMRGGSRYSMHSWGIAIDFDPERNRLKWGHPTSRLSLDDVIPFWEIWESNGWVSLGRQRDFDWMHVQAARL